uniref:(California timema) hypothetical protein n=1 Tax=Timema californicum TaxID=61474 RepID=A0A7R9JF33_TIMCA|nr:unnamed protein product [Timema californicum]
MELQQKAASVTSPNWWTTLTCVWTAPVPVFGLSYNEKPMCFRSEFYPFASDNGPAMVTHPKPTSFTTPVPTSEAPGAIPEHLKHRSLMAALFNSGRQFCGGSLIDSTHILTAAHCVAHMSSWDVSRVTVRLGDHNIKTNSEVRHIEKKVKRVVRHRGFDSRTLLVNALVMLSSTAEDGEIEVRISAGELRYNDLAILTMDSAVSFTKQIHPICLPSGKALYNGQTATVIGWGSLRESGPQPAVLQEVSIPVWTNSECKAKYGNAAPGGIVEHFLCAGQAGRDSCSVLQDISLEPAGWRDPSYISEGLLTDVIGQEALLTDVIGQEGLLTDVIGQEGLLTDVIGQEGLLTGVIGQEGLLTDVIGQEGLLADVIGQEGLLADVIGQEGLLADVIGQEGLLAGVIGQEGLLTDVIGREGWLTDVIGREGLLTDVIGQEGLLSGVIGQEGLLTDVIGQEGLLTDVIGQEGLLTDVIGQEGLLTDVIGQEG